MKYKDSGTTLVELLVFLFFCALLAWIGRFFLGSSGWLLGGVPCAIVMLILSFFSMKQIFIDVQSLGTRIQKRLQKRGRP